jgi:hypothetical protein
MLRRERARRMTPRLHKVVNTYRSHPIDETCDDAKFE